MAEPRHGRAEPGDIGSRRLGARRVAVRRVGVHRAGVRRVGAQAQPARVPTRMDGRPETWPLATLAVSAATGAAAVSWTRVFAERGWVGPVLVTAGVTHLAAWAGRRWRLNAWVALCAGLLLVVLLGIWTVLPSTTTDGLPLAPAVRAFVDALRQARVDFPDSLAPVAATRPFVLLAVLLTGVVALVADGLALRLRRPMEAALAPTALFIVASVSGTSQHRDLTTGLLVGALVVELAVYRVTVAAAGAAWLGGRRLRAAGADAGVAALVGTVAVVASVLAVPGPATADGHGALGWKGGGPGGGSTNRSVISPVVDLQTRLQHDGTTPVFTVQSPVQSYWRLTSLDTFTGVQWQSTDTYHGVSGTLPGLQAKAAGDPTVTERFHIQTLSSIWMPTAFTPAAVHGGGVVSWDPVSGSLLAGRSTSNGLTYSITSVRYLSGLTAAMLSALPRSSVAQGHTQYLELPSSVPMSVYKLAQTIVAGAHSEYAEAIALQDYFVDNPLYQYSLNPPDDGYGTQALTDFLFTTHTGYCQQFAGAYAVLARAAGLPTRLAIGFTTGTPLGNDTYQVTDADAHTWPEVWFGPSIGWLPFEPTKGGNFAIPGAGGYTGNTAGTTVPTVTTTPSTTPTTTPPLVTEHRAIASPAPVELPTPAPVRVAAAHHGTSRVVLGVVAAAAAAAVWLALGAGAWALRRHRRRRRGAALPPDQRNAWQVMASWADVVDALALCGIVRRADETVSEFTGRAGRQLTGMLVLPKAAEHLRTLGAVVEVAAYRSQPLDAGATGDALAAAGALGTALRRAGGTRRRLRRIADPRLAWRVPGDPAIPGPAPA